MENKDYYTYTYTLRRGITVYLVFIPPIHISPPLLIYPPFTPFPYSYVLLIYKTNSSRFTRYEAYRLYVIIRLDTTCCKVYPSSEVQSRALVPVYQDSCGQYTISYTLRILSNALQRRILQQTGMVHVGPCHILSLCMALELAPQLVILLHYES